jgi:signal transduction histidine kinase
MPTADPAAAPAVRRIVDLVSSRLHVHADEPTGRVVKVWEEHPDEEGMAVVGGDRVRYLSRGRFFLQLGKKFGYSLFENRPVALLAEDGSSVEADVDPVEVISLASQRDPERVFDDVVVLERGAFLGLVSMRSLIVHHRGLLVEGMAERALLEEGNRRLREATRLQSAFASRLAAELREPVNTLAALARALAADAEVEARHGRTLAALAGRARDVVSFVNDLQDLARLEAGTLDAVPESVVPAACVQGAVDEARQSGRLRSLDVRVGHLERPFRTDPLFLERIVAGLLGFAATLDPAPAVRLDAATDESGLVLRLAVTGGGPLHDAGATGEASARRLAVVRGLVSCLGGTLYSADGELAVRLPPAPG